LRVSPWGEVCSDGLREQVCGAVCPAPAEGGAMMATKKQIEDAERVLQAVLDSVPHEDFEERALALLVNAALAGAER